ncbi:MAG TPA: hypothetical protein VH592_19735 [Gemmataceae bacterium]|jgi:hypothetical protein
MASRRITLDELVAIIRSCDAIEIDRCTPDYFQDFVAMRLAQSFPELSAKVRQLDAEQMDRLCRCIKAAQAVLRQ